MATCSRVFILVMDSVGIGELPDAAEYQDQGSNTLSNVAKAIGGLDLPNLRKLGLGNIAGVDSVRPADDPIGAYGKMAERSPGKDSTTGHWEIAGLVLEHPFSLYPTGFPPEILEAFERATGRRVLGNIAASGSSPIPTESITSMKTRLQVAT